MGLEGISAQDLVREPQQERSRRTLRRIVGAALELIAERGVDGASVHDIARRAGSSVGSFYARFEGKEDLLAYLEVELWTDARATWEEALAARPWAELSFEELVGSVVRVLVELDRVGARQRRILEGRRGPGASSDAARAFHQSIRDDIRALVLRHRDRIRSDDPERAVDLCLVAVVGALRSRESIPLPSTLHDMDDDGWSEVLTRMCLAHLGGVEDSAGPRGQMDFFEIWG